MNGRGCSGLSTNPPLMNARVSYLLGGGQRQGRQGKARQGRAGQGRVGQGGTGRRLCVGVEADLDESVLEAV